MTIPGSGKWSSDGPLTSRPPFSDNDGLMVLPKDAFQSVDGWTFQGDWIIEPDPR